MNSFFKKAGDLVEENKYLKPAGDLTNGFDFNNKSKEEIDDYLLTVVSGKKYDSVCELGVLCGGGRMVVGYESFNKLLSDDVNIINAKYIGPNMIEVEFQQFKKDNNKGMVR